MEAKVKKTTRRNCQEGMCKKKPVMNQHNYDATMARRE